MKGTSALAAGAVLPAGIAILIRLIDDLSGQTVQAWWGFILLAAGGGIAVLFAWRAAADAGIGDSVANLVRRQGGLMMTAAGLALIARAADLPQAQSLALEAAILLALGGGLAGTAATLAAEAISASAGTVRLSRLGGLIHTMPWTLRRRCRRGCWRCRRCRRGLASPRSGCCSRRCCMRRARDRCPGNCRWR